MSKFGTNLGDKLGKVAEQSPKNDVAKTAVDAVFTGGDLFSAEEIAGIQEEAANKLAVNRQQNANAETVAIELAEQIRKLEAQVVAFKASVPNWKLVDKAAMKVRAADVRLVELRKQLEKLGATKAAGIGAFRTMRDTLQHAFEVLNAVPEGTAVSGSVYTDAANLYNTAMAMAIACGMLVEFVDGKAAINGLEVTIELLRGERVKVGDGDFEISREQREVVYGRGKADLHGVSYDMYGKAYWAPGAQQKPVVQGTVKSFRNLSGRLGKISRALGEAKGQRRQELVAAANLTAQGVLDRDEGTFAAFFPWDVQGGTKTVQAFLAVTVKDGVVSVSDAQVCLRQDAVGIEYPGRIDSRLYGILRRLAEAKPEEPKANGAAPADEPKAKVVRRRKATAKPDGDNATA